MRNIGPCRQITSPILGLPSRIPHREEIFAAVVASVLLHGSSAAPLARRYGRHIEAKKEGKPAMAEHVSVTEMPVRAPHPRR